MSDAAGPEAGKEYVCEGWVPYFVHSLLTMASKLMQFPDHS